MGKILGWFTGGASSLLPWAVVFGFAFSLGVSTTWFGWSLKYKAYEGEVATAQLKAVTEAFAKGQAVGKVAEEVRQELAARDAKTADSRQKVDKEIQNAKKTNSKFTSSECSWPDSLRQSYNAIGSGTVPRRVQGDTAVQKKSGS